MTMTITEIVGDRSEVSLSQDVSTVNALFPVISRQTRKFIIYGLDPKDTFTSQLPQIEQNLPIRIGMTVTAPNTGNVVLRCKSEMVRMTSGATAEAIVTIDNDPNNEPTASIFNGQWYITNNLLHRQTYVDINGNPIWVVSSFLPQNSDASVTKDLARLAFRAAASEQFIPAMSFSRSFLISFEDISDFMGYVGKINSNSILGQIEGSLLCTGMNITPYAVSGPDFQNAKSRYFPVKDERYLCSVQLQMAGPNTATTRCLGVDSGGNTVSKRPWDALGVWVDNSTGLLNPQKDYKIRTKFSSADKRGSTKAVPAQEVVAQIYQSEDFTLLVKAGVSTDLELPVIGKVFE